MIRVANTAPTSLIALTGRALDTDMGLRSTPNRRFDPAMGRWLDDEPAGYQGDGELHRHAHNRPR